MVPTTVPNKILLFDGQCNLCNAAVQFIIKRDKKAIIHFAPLQSRAAQGIMDKFSIDPAAYDSIIFIDNDKVYMKAAAALQVCRYLNNLWPAFRIFKILPRFVSNNLYDLIAKNRYRWFGKRNECMLPTPALKARFLP